MGILLNTAYLMLVEGRRQRYEGKVLQLGRQSILFNYEQLQLLASTAGYPLREVEGLDPTRSRLTDVEFFKSLGFTDVESMEYGTCEGATYIWDLNIPIAQSEALEILLSNKFDFVFDGGTIEHVFHVPNCMDSICRLLRMGGRVCHDGGVSGTIDHGFYAIQPTFFYDFYTAQGFNVDQQTVSKVELAKWLSHTGEQTIYKPGMYDYHKGWALSADSFHTSTVFATKSVEYTEMKMPQQSLWSRK